MIQAELDDLWDSLTACIICGRAVHVYDPDEVPLCDRCSRVKDEGEKE